MLSLLQEIYIQPQSKRNVDFKKQFFVKRTVDSGRYMIPLYSFIKLLYLYSNKNVQ